MVFFHLLVVNDIDNTCMWKRNSRLVLELAMEVLGTVNLVTAGKSGSYRSGSLSWSCSDEPSSDSMLEDEPGSSERRAHGD